MSTPYRYAAYVVQDGRRGEPILTKKALQERLKTAPQTIYVKAYSDNYIVEDPYEGVLSEAPHNLTLIIEGRKDTQPSREALMLGVAEYGAKEVTFQAYLEWSKQAKRWRIAM
jgi:hypothetical protein